MSTTVVASKEQSQTKRGQTQDQTPSSTRAKSLAPIPNVSVPNPSADAGDWQTRGVDASPITPHGGMSSAPKAALPGKGSAPRPSSVRIGGK